MEHSQDWTHDKPTDNFCGNPTCGRGLGSDPTFCAWCGWVSPEVEEELEMFKNYGGTD